ncbi:MAG TPA: hypothetical protein VHH36_00175, partial [Candidatus Thermoplasmatota archaeon]|nr:hypothetical protein [Candidatus Thermoplasmatota archaeon]
IVAGVALVAVAAVGAAAWVLTGEEDPSAAACAALPEADQMGCFEPYFTAAAGAGRTKDVLGELHALFEAGRVDDCHMLAHHFGHLAFPVHANLTVAMRAGDARCNGGYYHGSVEAALAPGGGGAHQHHHGAQAANATAPDVAGLCAPLRADPGVVYLECVHGMGHGLMYLHGHNVTRSLPGCDGFAKPVERGYCQDGVFMENVLQHDALDDEAYAAKLPTVCDGLALRSSLMTMCYRNIGEVATMHFRHDLARAEAICAKLATASARSACVDGARDEVENLEHTR